MLPGFARCAGIAAVAIGMALALAGAPTAGAQNTPPASAPASPAAPATPPAATPGLPASPPAATKPPAPAPATPVAPEGIETKPGDTFGKDVTLTPKPIVYLKGSGSWDNAFATISGSLKKVEAYVANAGLKADGLPMTIFLATDDRGFDYEAAIPLAQLPKDPPHGEMTLGQSPAGHALEFVHRGSYDSLDDTYEAITNYLDEKGLDSKNVLIEQYVTDPATADAKNMEINIFVLIN